jgi:hypothetical protein
LRRIPTIVSFLNHKPALSLVGGNAHRRWAAENPKRFLAAAVVAGTIDQALLSGLATRHAHLRGAALLRALLVVDEVHASDIYMSTVMEVLSPPAFSRSWRRVPALTSRRCSVAHAAL